MTLRIILLLGFLSLPWINVAAEARTKVLVITGGHGFEREPFFKMFADNNDIAATQAEHSNGTADAFDRADLYDFDAVVLYDMPKTISDSQKARFVGLTERGIGLVVLHHALVSYQHWPDYERVIGGRYPEEDGKGGVITEQVGYEHGLQVPVTISDKWHPVTAGISDFTMRDEIYWGYRVGADVVPLISTTHPKSAKPLGWFRFENKSRIVYLQPGHGPDAFRDANYARLLGQSIQFVARPRELLWTEIGKSLDEFEQHGGKAEFRMEGAEIIGRSVPGTPNSFLCTKKQYSDFALELEFRVDAGLNSGVMVRSRVVSEPAEFEWHGKIVKAVPGRVHGPQIEIDPSDRAWTAGLYGEAGAGWLNDLTKNQNARKAFRRGDWNKLRIECRGQTYRTWLNEIPAAGYNDDFQQSGFIALQVHGIGKDREPAEVRFRGIRLHEFGK